MHPDRGPVFFNQEALALRRTEVPACQSEKTAILGFELTQASFSNVVDLPQLTTKDPPLASMFTPPLSVDRIFPAEIMPWPFTVVAQMPDFRSGTVMSPTSTSRVSPGLTSTLTRSVTFCFSAAAGSASARHSARISAVSRKNECFIQVSSLSDPYHPAQRTAGKSTRQGGLVHPDWERISKKYDPIFNESIEPGTAYAYADYNGTLFGCLIEAISGQSVQNYLSSRVFTPLGLIAAYSPKFLPSGMVCKDLLKTDGSVEISVSKDRSRTYNNSPDPKGNNGYTVGKLYINAASLTKLAQMMYYGGELNGARILKAETVKLMEADQPGLAESRYGLSTVRLNQFDRGTWYGHQGRYSGLTSNIYYQRETGITMALILDGYDYQLSDNIVMPAVQILTNMEKLETLCLGQQ